MLGPSWQQPLSVQKSVSIGKQPAKAQESLCGVFQHTLSGFVGFPVFGYFGIHRRVVASCSDNECNPLLGFVIKSETALSENVCNSTESD